MNNVEAIYLLLDKGADLLIQSHYLTTPLFLCLRPNNEPQSTILLMKKILSKVESIDLQIQLLTVEDVLGWSAFVLLGKLGLLGYINTALYGDLLKEMPVNIIIKQGYSLVYFFYILLVRYYNMESTIFVNSSIIRQFI